MITEWALQSYLDLLGAQAFTRDEYWDRMRPNVLLLRHYPNPQEFNNDQFWSPLGAGGYKMKWHNMGNGNVQIRLPVLIRDQTAFLCEAYVKNSPQTESRMLARFKVHTQLIQMGRHTERGRLQ